MSLSLTQSSFTYYPNFGFWTNARYQTETHMWVLANDTYNTIYFVCPKTDLGDELGIENPKGKSVRVFWEEEERYCEGCGKTDIWDCSDRHMCKTCELEEDEERLCADCEIEARKYCDECGGYGSCSDEEDEERYCELEEGCPYCSYVWGETKDELEGKEYICDKCRQDKNRKIYYRKKIETEVINFRKVLTEIELGVQASKVYLPWGRKCGHYHSTARDARDSNYCWNCDMDSLE